MDRKEELEREIYVLLKKIDEAPQNTPQEVLKAWWEEIDSLTLEVVNLCNDSDNEK